MKKRKLAHSLLACSVLASTLCGAQAQAEISAQIDLANLYLFRGINMSQSGSPMVAGALDYAHSSGLYAGVWSTSGDDGAGIEMDYYLGFGGELGGLGYDLSYLNYYYPSQKGKAGAIVDFNDYAELTLALSFKGVDFSVTAPSKDDVAGDYLYYTLGYGYQAVSATLGINAHENKANSYSHLDVAYQFNDNLSFVLSQVLDTGQGSVLNTATLWQVNYSLPFSF